MTNDVIDDELKEWVRTQVSAAVKVFEERQIFDDAFIESKPAWAFPSKLVIGKARALSSPQSFRWFICGDVQFDHIDDAVAADPREALRHFAMKWQVDADRAENSDNTELRERLIGDAEFLYQLSEDNRLWSN